MASIVTGATVEMVMQVRSLEASVRFYRDVFGFVPCGTISFGRRLVALRLNDSVIKLVQNVEPLKNSNPRLSHTERAYGFYALTVNVADGKAIEEKCRAGGYEVDHPFVSFPAGVKSLPGGGVASIRDPDGNFIEVVQGVLWDEPSEAVWRSP